MTTDPEPATPRPADLPARIRVIEDLQRNRLTVFFRLLLAIPHFVWFALWTIAALLVSVVAYLIVLIAGQMPDGLHRFYTAYIRYGVHVYAYVSVAANPYPGFDGRPGYEVDVEFDPPAPQNRWKTAFRFVLLIPALLLFAALVDGGVGYTYSNNPRSYGLETNGVLGVCAVLTWFYALVVGRAPEGVVRLAWYCIHYAAQFGAYALLVTDRYPTTDPERIGVPWPAPPHPIRLTHAPDDGVRSRPTVFFRLLLAIPHVLWLILWSIAAFFAAIANWVATIVRGQSPDALHGFLAAYVRYETHVFAYLALACDRYPGFAPDEDSYPVDVVIADPVAQDRGSAAIRLILAIPALALNSAISTAMWVAAFLGWFAALFTGRMPDGLRKLILFSLRYNAQTNGYAFGLLTDRYPYAGPPADTAPDSERELWPDLDGASDEPNGFGPEDPRSDWKDSPFR